MTTQNGRQRVVKAISAIDIANPWNPEGLRGRETIVWESIDASHFVQTVAQFARQRMMLNRREEAPAAADEAERLLGELRATVAGRTLAPVERKSCAVLFLRASQQSAHCG